MPGSPRSAPTWTMIEMNDNPKVNRSLEDEGFDHIDHALGRPAFPLRPTFRDHFVTEAGGELATRFDASPHWATARQHGDMVWYVVTDAGRQALALHLDALGVRRFEVNYGGHSRVVTAHSRSAARYAYWLEVSDALACGFLDFARMTRVRRA